VDEFITQEDFKYVRALGAFYKRLTGRPADIYTTLEPLYNDYRKLRYRDIDEWKLVHMDEFVHSLFTQDRVCGIAMPRLPNRTALEEEGYLDGPRVSALSCVLTDVSAEEYLKQKVQEGSKAAQVFWDARRAKMVDESTDMPIPHDEPRDNKRKADKKSAESESRKKSKKKQDGGYGSLFKASSGSATQISGGSAGDKTSGNEAADEGSDEYWDEQRAKLGLKPLRK
jgi:pre-mRNA-splicing factor 38A